MITGCSIINKSIMYNNIFCSFIAPHKFNIETSFCTDLHKKSHKFANAISGTFELDTSCSNSPRRPDLYRNRPPIPAKSNFGRLRLQCQGKASLSRTSRRLCFRRRTVDHHRDFFNTRRLLCKSGPPLQNGFGRLFHSQTTDDSVADSRNRDRFETDVVRQLQRFVNPHGR